MQQTNVATICNKQAKLYTTDFYWFLRLALTRRPTTSPALIPSLWHPGSEKLECPVFHPRDQGEVSRIWHCLT